MNYNKLILELALSINKELFDYDLITYKIFRSTEENILKQLYKLTYSKEGN